MIGREKELEVLENLYQTDSFQFLVMYGRRRVGKTTILQEFANRQDVIFFSAQEKNDALNLEDFSEVLQRHFEDDFYAPFPSWERALDYISKKTTTTTKKIVIVIDEFPFIASQNLSIKSILQHTIDHIWKEKNVFLILCGSSVSFMVNDVMGYKSPLYGRITSQMEIKPFDYLDSAKFFPHYTKEEQIQAYGILGGIPRYLEAFDDRVSIEKNIATHILSENAFLHEEPQMLLRMELREPSVYNTILEAIASGYNKQTLIADHIHEERSKCAKYLQVLQSIRLIQKVVPCGENESSRKGIYILSDCYYNFWYRYPFSHKNLYTLLGPGEAAHEIMEQINDYLGPRFEIICKEYLIHQAKKRKLPFIPAHLGRWWGTNPAIRAQDDVDILALSEDGRQAIFCECKYRNQPMPMTEYEDLLTAAMAFPKVKEKYFYFFSKSGYTGGVIERANREGVTLLTLDDLL